MKCSVPGGCRRHQQATHMVKIKFLGERAKWVHMCNQHAHYWWIKCMKTTVQVSKPFRRVAA